MLESAGRKKEITSRAAEQRALGIPSRRNKDPSSIRGKKPLKNEKNKGKFLKIAIWPGGYELDKWTEGGGAGETCFRRGEEDQL